MKGTRKAASIRVLEDANKAFKGNKKLKKIVKEARIRGTTKGY